MKYSLIVFLLVFSRFANGQSFEWVREGSGLGQDAGQRVVTDGDGNVYVTGYFSGEAVFSGKLFEGNGIFDIFLAKYASSGELLWLKSAGGVQNDSGFGVGIDSDGFIYITGYFTMIATFGESPNVVRLTSSGSSNDIFVAKYDGDGKLIWVKKAGGQKEDRAQHLQIDQFNNIFITGYFSERCYFENKTAISVGSTDAFIAKYDTEGNCQWVQTVGGFGLDKAFGLAVDSSGYSYITGFFYYDAFLSNSNDTIRGEGLSSDIFICRYSPLGDIVLAKRAGGPYNDAAFGIAVDKDKAILVTGYFLEEIDFGDCHLQNYRYNDVFVAKYDSTFQCEWARHEGGEHLDMGLDIAVDKIGNVYVTGIYDSLSKFGNRTISSVDYYDMFICKYSGKGIMLWMQSAGGDGGDFSKAISVRDDGTIHVTGYYKLNCKFGSIDAQFSQEADVFLTRISQPVGIENTWEALTYNIYPNPNSGEFFIELNELNSQPASISMLDITGKIIFRQTMLEQENRIPIKMQVSPGVYILRVETKRSFKSGKVVIH